MTDYLPLPEGGLKRQGSGYFPIRFLDTGGEPLPVLVSPLLEEQQGFRHLFTTRAGGTSGGIFRTLNLSFARGDVEACVRENFRRVAAAFGSEPDRIVSTHQTHTDNIRIVTEEDAGKGVTRERDYDNIDGLLTNTPGLILGVYVADCVPVLLVDPVSRAIGAVHSGWRGTAAGIGAKAAALMKKQFGSKPEDLICAVGPSICRNCYEISEDVAAQIASALGQRAGEAVFAKERTDGKAAALSEEQLREIASRADREAEQKYFADLWQANRIILENAGVLPQHISVTDVCTACNSEYLFSHRASHGKRGNMGAFLMIEP